jgi:hypothetical protein
MALHTGVSLGMHIPKNGLVSYYSSWVAHATLAKLSQAQIRIADRQRVNPIHMDLEKASN